MLLTQKNFQKSLEKGTTRLAFIGMSNIGKSHCAQLLKKEANFSVYEVDKAIQEHLQLSNWEDAASWLGYPYEPQYKAQEKRYLELEERLTTTIPEVDTNLVLDTTGSVIYLSQKVKDFLKKHFLVIAFDVSEAMLEEMQKAFFAHPKTLIWGDAFQQKENQEAKEALLESYPRLLQQRKHQYQALADIILPGEFSRYPHLTGSRLLEVIAYTLPKG